MMKRAEQIISQMRRNLAGPDGEIQAMVGGLQVRLKLADWDRLGCLLERLEITHARGGTLGLDPARIEAKVTYLGEPLAVIEAEEDGGKTILRSAPPRRDGEEVCFFEMVLDRSEGLSLVRYAYDRLRKERLTVPAPLTISTLDRLLTDLVELAEN
jgi:hypothetical protein